jgi:ATP-binding cassette subfamily F protein uup
LRGAKARTTKSSSRIEGAQTLFETLAKTRQRNRSPKAAISFLSSQRETRKLLSVKNLGKLPLFSQLEFTLSPGTRLALLGPNGSGKTTLLRLLAGELSADQGTIKRADNLQIAYFDQHRSALPLTLTLQEALSPEGQYVTYQGNLVHINTWCKRFLFSPDRLPTPLSRLSGGERARIALAHLMLKPADLLLLDEPTNDLDIPTLEVLEESLLQFPGAVVLISHDRRLLERTCNSFVSLAPAPSAPKPSPRADPVVRSPAPFDFRKLERQIDKLESELKALTDSLETASDVPVTCRAIDLLQTKIDQLYSQLQ